MKALLCALTVLLAPPELLDPTTVDFGTLAGFDYEEGMELPDSVTKYDQEEVTVSGFMQREDDGTGAVEYFLLINDACGCDGTPMLNELIYCAMPSGETTDILAGVVEVTGTLFVGEEKEDGMVIGIYSLDVETVSN